MKRDLDRFEIAGAATPRLLVGVHLVLISLAADARIVSKIIWRQRTIDQSPFGRLSIGHAVVHRAVQRSKTSRYDIRAITSGAEFGRSKLRVTDSAARGQHCTAQPPYNITKITIASILSDFALMGCDLGPETSLTGLAGHVS